MTLPAGLPPLPGKYAPGVDGVHPRRERGVNSSAKASSVGLRIGGVDAVLGETEALIGPQRSRVVRLDVEHHAGRIFPIMAAVEDCADREEKPKRYLQQRTMCRSGRFRPSGLPRSC